MNPDPFEALGLPARPDLSDEQVRAAWRAIAAATHPDRADGGDLARYTAASAAYAELRTPWGRSEAYADLLQQAGRDAEAPTGPLPVIPADDAEPGSLPRHPLAAVLEFPTRVRRGRPVACWCAPRSPRCCPWWCCSSFLAPPPRPPTSPGWSCGSC